MRPPGYMDKKPELLAPAGSIECFHAAIDAGADAVYLGLVDFSARMRAKNFTVKTLSYLVPYARAKKRKVYVTLNTLVKQSELENLVNILYQLEQIGVDGIIVQDFGIIEICHKNFPRLKLHASTQMSIHNSLGVSEAARMGICRAVLARELTLQEISAIARKSPIELELFVHGALCYSISGMCLASSFLGGNSGNRGRCTQVCRRPFEAKDKKGCFFSPGDLCALAFLEEYRDINISSFKIEGRMKSVDYVSFVVSVYRKAIDNPKSIPGLMEKIAFDLGRKKTSLFVDGIKTDGIIYPYGPSGTGLMLGVVEDSNGAEITIAGNYNPAQGDVIRIQPLSGFEGKNVKVAGVSEKTGGCVALLTDNIACNKGDTVYLTRRALSSGKFYGGNTVKNPPQQFMQFCPRTHSIMAAYSKPPAAANVKSKLLIKINDPLWLKMLNPDGDYELIASFEKKETEGFFVNGHEADAWMKKIILGFPPFIPDAETGDWEKIFGRLEGRGFCRIMCSNLGQWRMFDKNTKVTGDSWLWCFNRAARAALFKAGVYGFTYSLEDDFPNIRSIASASATACVYSRIPLFISRIKPVIPEGTDLKDALGNEFTTASKYGLYFLLAKEPLCLFHKRNRLVEAGVNFFIIDLSFCKPDKIFFDDLMNCYRQGIKIPGSGMFNFKAGIK
jgi:U32 family peptidase